MAEIVEVESGSQRAIKDLFSGAAGGIAQVLIGQLLWQFIIDH